VGCAFLTANGERMESGQITRALQATWKKANLSDKITRTLVRKSAVSAVHQEAPGMAGNLADLMCHRTATAERCYRAVNREKTCVAGAKALSEQFRASVSNSSRPKTPAFVNNASSSSVVALSSNSGLCKVFNQFQATVLLEKCDHIVKEGPIGKERIKEALTISDCGLQILENFTMEQIVNRLKYERKKHLLSC